jgi:hypothetical protein
LNHIPREFVHARVFLISGTSLIADMISYIYDRLTTLTPRRTKDIAFLIGDERAAIIALTMGDDFGLWALRFSRASQ